MLRLLAGAFLIGHGLVHAAIWMPPRREDAPFDAAHSWLFGEIRRTAVALASAISVAFVAAGVGLVMSEDWWALAAAGAAGLSILLLVLTYTPWWLAALVIDALILWRVWPPLMRTLG